MEIKNFYSKILLFGEYSAINGSMALAVPYKKFDGHLAFGRPKNERSQAIDNELLALCEYIKQADFKDLEVPLEKELVFDIESFEFDIRNGLRFTSSIPKGHGLGSSGALTAAIMDRYSNLNQFKSLLSVKSVLSIVESHFHGASSGIDPLISFKNNSYLFKKDESPLKITFKEPNNKTSKVLFLLDSGRARRTEPLVNLFLEKSKTRSFVEKLEKRFIKNTNDAIVNLLEYRFDNLRENFHQISQFQFEEMRPMIPKLMENDWKNSLEKDRYHLKLCGSGGGGYFLGLTDDIESTKKELSKYSILSIFHFD